MTAGEACQMLQVFSRFCCSCRLEARYFSDPCQEVEAAKFQILKSFKFYNARMNCKGEFRRPPKQQTRGSIKPGRFAARIMKTMHVLAERFPHLKRFVCFYKHTGNQIHHQIQIQNVLIPEHEHATVIGISQMRASRMSMCPMCCYESGGRS